MSKAKKDKFVDKHALPQFGLRMPSDLRGALEAQVDIYNRTREIGQPPRTLTTEIMARLYASLGVETAVAKVVKRAVRGPQMRLKGVARG